MSYKSGKKEGDRLMKAIRFMDPGVIEYSEIPQPEIRDDEVLAQITYAGFCATEI